MIGAGKITLTAGMGELVISSDPSVDLLCLGLGSCIAVCAYAPARRVGAIAHVVLPSTSKQEDVPTARYADVAIPLLATRLREKAVSPKEVKVVLCGGAAIFPPLSDTMDIGRRNLAAVRDQLRRAGMRVVKEDVGGQQSRTVALQVATGLVRVRTVHAGEFALIELGTP